MFEKKKLGIIIPDVFHRGCFDLLYLTILVFTFTNSSFLSFSNNSCRIVLVIVCFCFLDLLTSGKYNGMSGVGKRSRIEVYMVYIYIVLIEGCIKLVMILIQILFISFIIILKKFIYK